VQVREKEKERMKERKKSNVCNEINTEGDPNGILIKVVVTPKYGSSNKKLSVRTQSSIGTVR
jgi:hypothetical protein